MKRLIIGAFVLAGSLVTASSFAQVRIHANIGFGVPVYSAPPVVYEPSYPVYDRGYGEVVVVNHRRGYYDRNGRFCESPNYNERYDRYDRGRHRGWDRDDRRGYDRDDRRGYDRDDRYRGDHDRYERRHY